MKHIWLWFLWAFALLILGCTLLPTVPPEAPATRVLPSPAPTATETSPPTVTAVPTPTPGLPKLTVSVNTRCRMGPGTVYDQVTTVRVGDEVDVVGRWENFWLVRLADGTICWVWGEYATVTGDLSRIPAATPPPTPPLTGTIEGIVFIDVRPFNGRYDPGHDGPRPDILVELRPATGGRCGGTLLRRAISDGQGRFAFQVQPGTYCVYAEMSGMASCHVLDVVTVARGQTIQVAFYAVGCSPYDPNCQCP